MSGIDIANLSYKELQALALRYRVPGNIKKQLLIEVLNAAKCGNEQEVDKLLAELRQTRKKRIRKGKPTKLTMSLASTPIHSPNYDVADEYYSAQHRLPYQWVGAEEEIPIRPDEGSRIPQYEEFRQFLLRRIQRDYQTYNTNLHGERVDPVDPGGIMDLRNDQGDNSVRFETEAMVARATNMASGNGTETQSYSGQAQGQNAGFDYQIFEDPNGNGSASFLLRRMLQAPVGANLGEIASPEPQGPSCRIWTGDYQSQNNLLDNSDTLSANSEVNGNDDNDWLIGNEYYRLVNSVRDHLIQQNTAVAGNPQSCNREFAPEQAPPPGQFCGALAEENPAQYQLLYSDQMTDLTQQYQHQQWAPAASVFDTDNVSNYQKLKNHGSKVFGASGMFYEMNYATARAPESDPSHMQQQYANVDAGGYVANQNGFEGNNSSASATSNSEMKLYQNLNNELDRANPELCSAPIRQNHEGGYPYPRAPPVMQSTIYYADSESQQMTQALPPSNMQHVSFFPHNQPAHNGYGEDLGQATTTRFSQGEDMCERPCILGQYHDTIVDPLMIESEQPSQGDSTRRTGTEGPNKNVQSDSATNLEAFWPQRSETGQRYAKDKCLENILNLRTQGYVDYSRIDQTSCIYCYSAPIVTQRLSSPESTCSQKKRFIAEFRQHTFSPYWLLYNDADTGMRMSRDVDEAQSIIPSGSENAAHDLIVTNIVRAPGSSRNVDETNAENLPPSETHDSDVRLEELEAMQTGEKRSSLESNVHSRMNADGRTEDSNDPDETESSFHLNMQEKSSEKIVIEDQKPPASA